MRFEIRRDLPILPARVRRLPVDERGYPVPWFVQWMHSDGSPCEGDPAIDADRPDFRVIDARRMVLAVNHRRCWVCGEQLGRCLAFVIGPMCAINRINSEPPSHRDCAEFAARACPFLTRPRMVRREDNLPEGIKEPAGIGLTRNPGVTLLWVTRSYRPFKVDNGWLFRLGDPEEVCWYCQGRPATRAEIMASVDSGLPLLRDAAEVDGAEVIAEIEQRYRDLERLLPQGAAA
jgi:hypothetical protein